MKKYYKIQCARGHAGTGHANDISFVFAADNMLAAMDMAKRMPSVKHTRAVLNAKEITLSEYLEYRKVSAYDRNPSGEKKGSRIL